MDRSQRSLPVRGHVRNKSSTKASRPRSSTKGPLDVDDNPLASPAAALQPRTAAAISAATASTPLSPPPQSAGSSSGRTSSRYSPGLSRGSPGPGSPMHRLAAAQSPPPSRGEVGLGLGLGIGDELGAELGASVASAPPRAKDFSYLLRPEIYHSLPDTNVPPFFRASHFRPDLDTPLPDLLAAGHFRAAAIAAARQLTGTGGESDGQAAAVARPNPTDHATIFSLLYTRLACLLLIDATLLAAQEGKALEDLNNPFYVDDATGAHLVPWELRVLNVRLQALGFGDPRRAVMSYYELAREARAHVAAAAADHDNSARELWKGRLAELGIKVAGALIEMDDVAGAAAHLASMSGSGSGGGGPKSFASRRIETAKALLWLHLGDVEAARASVQAVAGASAEGDDLAPRVVLALCDMADDEYETALATWRELREDAPDDEMIGVNMAVCLLYVGRMEEGRQILESLVDAHYSSHTLLFNLSTIYELCTDQSKRLKQQLAHRVAEMEPSPKGWEKTNADFKL